MIDAYIPEDALSSDTERELINRVGELVAVHEVRRVLELTKYPGNVKNLFDAGRAAGPVRVWVHHDEVYVNGAKREDPCYKFIVCVHEGQADDLFRIAVSRDITQAVANAEAGRWPNPEARVWVFMWEAPEGTWAARGAPFGLKDMIAIAAPDLPDYADRRLAEHRRDQAVALLGAAGVKTD